MNLKDELNKFADTCIFEFQSDQFVQKVDVGDWGWENHVFRSPSLRHGHVEKFFTDNLDVLHVTIFPRQHVKLPIFGFDVVVGGRNRRILSAFMDMTPTVPDTKYLIKDEVLGKFEYHRKLPDWANMFSDTFLAVRPSEDEYDILFEEGIHHFKKSMDLLRFEESIAKDELEIVDIIGSQNYYCEQQWKNERTMGALKAKLGEEKANEFMTKVLFPKIESDFLS